MSINKVICFILGVIVGIVVAVFSIGYNKTETIKFFEIVFQGIAGSLFVSLLIYYLSQDYQTRQESEKRINKVFILLTELIRHRRFLAQLIQAKTEIDVQAYVALGLHSNPEWGQIKSDLCGIPDKLVRIISLHQEDMENIQKLIKIKGLYALIENDDGEVERKIERVDAILEGCYSITDPKNAKNHWGNFQSYFDKLKEKNRNVSIGR